MRSIVQDAQAGCVPSCLVVYRGKRFHEKERRGARQGTRADGHENGVGQTRCYPKACAKALDLRGRRGRRAQQLVERRRLRSGQARSPPEPLSCVSVCECVMLMAARYSMLCCEDDHIVIIFYGPTVLALALSLLSLPTARVLGRLLREPERRYVSDSECVCRLRKSYYSLSRRNSDLAVGKAGTARRPSPPAAASAASVR